MAVVAAQVVVMTPPWPGHGSATLTVYADNTGNRRVDRIEIDNSGCSLGLTVTIDDQDDLGVSASRLAVRRVEANAPVESLPIPGAVRWRQGTKGVTTPTPSKYLFSWVFDRPEA